MRLCVADRPATPGHKLHETTFAEAGQSVAAFGPVRQRRSRGHAPRESWAGRSRKGAGFESSQDRWGNPGARAGGTCPEPHREGPFCHPRSRPASLPCCHCESLTAGKSLNCLHLGLCFRNSRTHISIFFFFFFLIFQSNCLKCKHLSFHSILEESF